MKTLPLPLPLPSSLKIVQMLQISSWFYYISGVGPGRQQGITCSSAVLPRVTKIIVVICVPEPSMTESSMDFLGGRNTSPWTNFQPNSSWASSCNTNIFSFKSVLKQIISSRMKPSLTVETFSHIFQSVFKPLLLPLCNFCISHKHRQWMDERQIDRQRPDETRCLPVSEWHTCQ